MTLISAVVICFVSILTLVYAYFKHAFGYWRSRGIPHDEPEFPVGNIKGLAKTCHQSQFFKDIYDRHKSSGAKFCGFYFFAGPGVVLMDLDLIKSVLVKDFANFDDRGIFYYNEEDDPISAHLIALDGEKWKKLRAKLTPTFSSSKMKFMFPTMVEVGERLKDYLIDVVKTNDELEIKDLMARFTIDVIGTCLFGIECNSLSDPNAEFRKYGKAVFEKPRHHPLIAVFLAGYRNIARKLHIKNFRDDVSEFFMEVVRDTVEYREKNNVNRNDFMDILIKLKNEETNDKDKILTLNVIAAQVFGFFVAGFDSSSSTLSYCLYELALNPEIQAKARRVIQEAFEKHGTFTYEMMLDMPYIEHVLQETLRKYPTASNLIRKTMNDYQVPGTNDVIQKGLSVIIPVFAIQHDSRYYADPEKFSPDRFDGEEAKQRNSMLWLPFGEGPRSCIAARFGMMQTRIGLVTILNIFEVSLCSKTGLTYEPKTLFLTPKGGLYLKFKAIKQ